MGITDIVEELRDAVTFTEKIEEIVKRAELRAKTVSLRQSAPLASPFPRILGESEPMRQIRGMLGKVMESDSTILITGEPGTGKSLVARSLHDSSARATRPFLAIICRDIRRESANIDFFGCVHGGLLAQASGGTLFLNEVAELPAEVQVLLCRMLKERLVRPIGNCKELGLQARIIATSSRDVEAEVAQQQLRRDFFFRLNVVRIHLCPLRERGSDVLLLAQHFLRRRFRKSASTKASVRRGLS